jgi:hypothetical protein
MLFSDLIGKARNANPPPGYHAAPGSHDGSYRKWVGGPRRWDYWNPKDAERAQEERERSEPVVVAPPLTPEAELLAFCEELRHADTVVVTSRVIDLILSIHSLKPLKAIRAAIQSRIKARGSDNPYRPKSEKPKSEKPKSE